MLVSLVGCMLLDRWSLPTLAAQETRIMQLTRSITSLISITASGWEETTSARGLDERTVSPNSRYLSEYRVQSYRGWCICIYVTYDSDSIA